MNATEIRKARGMLLDRISTLDKEIEALYATDPTSQDIAIALREKSETKKALVSLESLAS